MSESIFPSFAEEMELQNGIENQSEDVYKCLGIDFTTGDLLIRNGDYVLVEKDEAIKVWCYFALRTDRNKYLAFNSFGNEFEDEIISHGYEDNEFKINKLVENCLLQNKYIKSVDNIKSSFEDDKLTLDITITTVYSKGVKVS